MKRILTLLVALVMLATPVMAQTTVDTYWSGSGNFDTHFVSGDDAHSDLWTFGNFIAGEYHAKDYDDNPYGYNVDTTNSNVEAIVLGGGFIEYQHIRDDSKTSMYGSAGQKSYSLIVTDDTAEMAFASWTNYAALKDCEYGKPRTSGNHHFEADGGEGSFNMYHELTDGSGDGSSVKIYGSGSAWIDLMNSETGWSGSPKSSFKFGKGCGCYKDADAGMTGVGTFEQHAWADNQLNIDISGMTIPGDGSDDSAQYHVFVNYAGSFSYPDLALDGN